MFEQIVLITVIIFFIIASIEDIKKREVYDYINYSFTFFILIIGIFSSILEKSIEPISYVGFGLLIGFFFGSLLYYLGIWGGGDAKFLIGFGASIYFLKDFKPQFDITNIDYNLLSEAITYYLNIFFNPFIKIILIINFIFLTLLLINMIFSKRKEEKKELFTLFSIMFLLLTGLYFDYSEFTLFLLGFIAFLLIFFGKEDLFECVYLKVKVKIKNLKLGDRINEDIKKASKILIPFEKGKKGLTNKKLNMIKNELSDKEKNQFIHIRKILPYSILVSLNYIGYIFKIVKVNPINLSMLGYTLKFLLLSFISGGVIVFVIIFAYYIKNFKTIEIKIKKAEYLGFGIIFFASLYFVDKSMKVTLLMNSLIVIYLFIKVAKKVEKLLYVKKKEIDKIVPGDWIVQDIKTKDYVLFHKEDFNLGISEEQIEVIKRYAKQDPNLSHIMVKDGIAFLPPLFIAFLLMFLI